jgi:hypothetical protein
MVEPPFGTLLVPAVGRTSLAEPGLSAAGETAIALPAITVGTQKKHRAAFVMQTNPWSQNHFARSRHAYSQAALDNGYGSMSG